MKYITPAVVLGMAHNGLGIVRSLARHGIPVIAIDNDAMRDAMKTRYGEKRIFQHLHGPGLISELLQLGKQFSSPVPLFLTREMMVRTVSQHRNELAAYYKVLLPNHDVVMRLDHKESFQTLAAQGGFPIPRSVHVRTEADMEIAKTLTFPCALKPGVKTKDYITRFKKAYKLNSYEEFADIRKSIAGYCDDLILQEWVEGGDADIYFCLQYRNAQGKTLASFVGRKIRAWPPLLGGTASCTADRQHETELSQLTQRFFDHAGFIGMGSMEYKKDPRTGKFYMIEPTVSRADMQEEVAALNGINIPLAAYHDLLNLPKPKFTQTKTLHVWRDTPSDQRSAKAQNQETQLEFKGMVLHDTFFRINDPGPWLAGKLRAIKAKLRLTQDDPRTLQEQNTGRETD